MRFYSKSDCWVINAPSQQSTCIGLSISLTASHKHIHIINKEYCSNLVCGFTSSLAIFFQHLGLQILTPKAAFKSEKFFIFMFVSLYVALGHPKLCG